MVRYSLPIFTSCTISMYGIFTYIYHRNQPNIGTVYIPYMDGMGMAVVFHLATQCFQGCFGQPAPLLQHLGCIIVAACWKCFTSLDDVCVPCCWMIFGNFIDLSAQDVDGFLPSTSRCVEIRSGLVSLIIGANNRNRDSEILIAIMIFDNDL